MNMASSEKQEPKRLFPALSLKKIRNFPHTIKENKKRASGIV